MKGQDNPLIPNLHSHLLNSIIKNPIIVPSSYQPKKTHKPRTAIRTTKISQSNRPINLVADETVYKEWEDRMKRVATTASSLDAEQDSVTAVKKLTTARHNLVLPVQVNAAEGKKQSRRKQKKTIVVPHPSDSTADVPNEESVPTHSNDPLLSGEDILKLTDLMDMCTKLSERVLDLEHTKTAQAQEITNLKLRVKKLEKKAGLRTHKFKRLYKVGVTRRVEYSDDESLGAQEDASNQGRSIEYIDKDAEVSLVDETQGRSDDAEMFNTDALIGNEVFAENDMIEKDQDVIPKEVSIAAPSTTATPPPVITEVEITLAQTLANLKSAKYNVVIQEPIQNKRKAKMDKPEVPLKKKDHIALDEEMARNLEAQIQTELIKEERLARKKEEEANIALIESWGNTQAMMEAEATSRRTGRDNH
ncbi:hypothetical protein Tco_0185166 [Tanacetum coccineum]